MSRRTPVVLALLVAAALAQGCILSQSVSKSARAASDSVSNLLMSTTNRVTAAEEYRNDVRVATRDLIETNAPAADLQREIGRIADLHGISHWEAEPGTFTAIGAGACEAGAATGDVDALLVRLGRDTDEERARAREGCRAAEL